MTRNTGPDPFITKGKRSCSIPKCDRPFYARTWCRLHYQRWYHHGDPLGGLWRYAERQRHNTILREMRAAYAVLRKVVER